MNININFKDTLNSIVNFINEYKRYFISFLALCILYISVHQYIRSKHKEPATVEKTYSKINLESDINILDCKLEQRICYYNNITNTLEQAIENCKSFDYCDSLK